MRLVAILLCLLTIAPMARAVEFEGAFTQGGLVRGKASPGARVTLDGQTLKVSADGDFVFGFGRDETGPVTLTVTRPDGTDLAYRFAVAPRDYDIQRIDGLDEDKVTPPPEYYARRKRETGRVAAARGHRTDALDWTGGFDWPATGRISGVYGSQRILNGKPRWPHYGVDVAAPAGTPVAAPAAGIVRLADSDFLLEGGIVIIDHGFGVTSTLFHLQRVDVAEGERVARGQTIGAMGATGRATGAHVDWRINWGRVRLDPQLIAGPLPDQPTTPHQQAAE
ncbi:peptidase M23 [Rhodothalassium salexigens]|uniref:M23 family metallopeptidase n=1 Tax=Rhodothalassium salexigens TaxID=1086 RepID=UPI00191235CD|nr:M23 family metallopeptidase [Rhodothalassium salexigens]MBK5912242.1 peptidase M23 [Rhodothalassium salexigens]MBK5919435.1 peptidase M23 [Rhodothalassium salexigens]